jgi:acyl-CoA reductase-like NAD-dependent aldehyde dehydrogenase
MCVPVAVDGAFGNNGERCTSIKRIIIEREIADRFLDRFAAETAKLQVGDQMSPTTDVGPLIDEAVAAEIEDRVNRSIAAGARLVIGNRRQGTLYWPTILDHVTPDMPVVADETFGPVAPLIRVDDFEEALRVANDTPFGLQSGIFTNDLAKAMEAARRIKAGAVKINKGPGFRAEHLPFGGVKDSGIGREGVKYAVEAMTTLKTIVI